ncbi:mandelate racemase/muconate lactonizing enzyme family protein [Rhodococcus sp. NPDC057529]|uniref:mandelate racemase/muconate lactonizing enzyme family protein n=1 Tax=Rhodococcus sp. NPDC057529 TaxID=3346158 RepID=UPI00366D5E22
MRMIAGDLLRAEHVLVRVHTDDGLVGQAEAPARPMFYGESLASIVAAINDWFAPVIVGKDPFAVQSIRRHLDRVVANNTAKGAIDMALHDLRGKAVGLPVRMLLGGSAEPLRVTHMLGLGDPAAVADEAADAQATYGASSFKVKVGHREDSDLDCVTRVRGAVGEDATIYVDANQAYEPEDAIRILARMRDVAAISWVEEPTPAADFLGRRRVANALPIPILGDESCPTVGDVAREVVGGAARYISIKVARTGFTASADIVALVTALGGRVLIGSQGDSGIGALCGLAFGSALPAAAALPAELSYFHRLSDDLLCTPPQITGGYLHPGDAPGIGIEIDDDKLDFYRVDKERCSVA